MQTNFDKFLLPLLPPRCCGMSPPPPGSGGQVSLLGSLEGLQRKGKQAETGTENFTVAHGSNF